MPLESQITIDMGDRALPTSVSRSRLHFAKAKSRSGRFRLGNGKRNRLLDYIRNSWGIGWEMSGYIKMKRGVNLCATSSNITPLLQRSFGQTDLPALIESRPVSSLCPLLKYFECRLGVDLKLGGILSFFFGLLVIGDYNTLELQQGT